MKKLFFLAAAAACVALTQPVNGKTDGPRSATPPDSAEVEWDDAEADSVEFVVDDEGGWDDLTDTAEVDTMVVDMEDEGNDAAAYADTLAVRGGLAYVLVYPQAPGDVARIVALRGADTVKTCRVEASYTDFTRPDEKGTMYFKYGVETSSALSLDALPESFCFAPACLTEGYGTKQADYDHSVDDGESHHITFNATVSYPSDAALLPSYNAMLARILDAMTAEPDAGPASPSLTTEQLIEHRWEKLKKQYISDMADNGYACDYAFRLKVAPAWQWPALGFVTYRIEDDGYWGGAHGMPYFYYLTLNTRTGQLVGLSDLFKGGDAAKALQLVTQKLQPVPDGYLPDAEIDAPGEEDYTLRAGALQEYKDKWYPRPALTDKGVVFTYQPYVKDCFAAGCKHIVLPYEEVESLLRIDMKTTR